MTILLLAYLVTLTTELTSSDKDMMKSNYKTNTFKHHYDFNITDYAFMPTFTIQYIGKANKTELIQNDFDIFAQTHDSEN
jgi:hypothetical protein